MLFLAFQDDKQAAELGPAPSGISTNQAKYFTSEKSLT